MRQRDRRQRDHAHREVALEREGHAGAAQRHERRRQRRPGDPRRVARQAHQRVRRLQALGLDDRRDQAEHRGREERARRALDRRQHTRCQICGLPASRSSATSAWAAPRTTSAASITCWRGSRSAHTPPASRKAGAARATRPAPRRGPRPTGQLDHGERQRDRHELVAERRARLAEPEARKRRSAAARGWRGGRVACYAPEATISNTLNSTIPDGSTVGNLRARPARQLDRHVEEWRRVIESSTRSARASSPACRAGLPRQAGRLHGLEGLGLAGGEWELLHSLRRQGAPWRATSSALASDLLLSPSALTNRVDQLEKRGLVRGRRHRRPAPGARRADRRGRGAVRADDDRPGPFRARARRRAPARGPNALNDLLRQLLSAAEAR